MACDFVTRHLALRHSSSWLTLVRAPGLHAAGLRPLLEQFGSVDSILAASLRCATAALSPLADWLPSEPSARTGIDAELRWLEHDAHHFIPLGAPGYPPLLAEVSDAPIGLFVRGDPAALSLPQLAIVGSRNPTAGGCDNATSFAAHLARCGLAITSGLAIGIDAAAHRGALAAAGGVTVAVCGTGLDIDYPAANSALAADDRGSAARSSANFRSACRRCRPTSRVAIASSADCRSARWSWKPRCAAAR